MKASLLATVRRLFVWLLAALIYAAGTAADALRRRNTLERRAIRLRRTLERLGGTFLKFGQQMSPRIVEAARPGATVPERRGRPRHRARHRRALSWLIGLAELLTLVYPGQLREMLRDLETMFTDELDFRKEARFIDLFGRYRFSYLAGKAVFAASTLLQWIVLTLTMGVVWGIVLAGSRLWHGVAPRFSELPGEVAGDHGFLGLAAVLLAVSVRRVLFRFADKEV